MMVVINNLPHLGSSFLPPHLLSKSLAAGARKSPSVNASAPGDEHRGGVSLCRCLVADGERVAELDSVTTWRNLFDQVWVAAPERVFGDVVQFGGLLDTYFAAKR
jgi:hypothetical protein